METVLLTATNFLENLIMIGFLSGLASYIISFFKRKSAAIILGLVFGLFIVLGIKHSIPVKEGAFISCTQILITLAGYTGGPITAVIAAIIGVLNRIQAGGCGMAAGVTVLVFFAYFGCYLRQRYTFEQVVKPDILIKIGMAIALMYLGIMLGVNGIVNSLGMTIRLTKHLFLPILIGIPIINFVVFKLFILIYNSFTYKIFTESILKNSSFEIGAVNNAGEILFATKGLLENSMLKSKVSELGKEHQLTEKENIIKFTADCNGVEKLYSLNIGACPLPCHESGCVVILNDISDRRDLELEIARLDRLNLVGQMAAGIGHEVRNPLTTVRGFLQLIMRRRENINYEHLQLMIAELDRANLIISEFLSLAKNKLVQREESNLNKIIKAIVPLIEAQALLENKLVKLDLTEIGNQPLDEKEITQMILNLSKNGIEAMNPGGILTICTYKDGADTVLAIQDEGQGIPDEVLVNIGTPFVTTKDTGTGLGLPICYSIAYRHNATIKVDTSSTGTCFKIVFGNEQG